MGPLPPSQPSRPLPTYGGGRDSSRLGRIRGRASGGGFREDPKPGSTMTTEGRGGPHVIVRKGIDFGVCGPIHAVSCSALHDRARWPRTHHQKREAKIATITQRTRVNDQIRISPVRLIGADGEQHGIVALTAAKESAAEAGLDLVEVAPTARPPVVRIMDWGKRQYEEAKAARESRKRQHTVSVKEVKFRPATDSHDIETKLRHARRFLRGGSRVKVTVRYRGRELRRPELGRQVLETVADALDDLATVESRPSSIEGRQMSMMLAPDADAIAHAESDDTA